MHVIQRRFNSFLMYFDYACMITITITSNMLDSGGPVAFFPWKEQLEFQ